VPNINDVLGSSKYLKAGDLKGRAVKATIDAVKMEELGQGADAEVKPVVYFRNAEKALVLNVTNGRMIASYYGDETDAWAGAVIELYPDKVPFQGRIVDALRVRVPNPGQVAAQQQPNPAPPEPEKDDPGPSGPFPDDPDIPF